MSEAEIRDLVMELYLLHGEREFIATEYEFMFLFGEGLILWAAPDDPFSGTVYLTPKALKLIREE